MKSFMRNAFGAFLRLNAKLMAVFIGVVLVGGATLFAFTSIFAVDTATLYFTSDNSELTDTLPNANVELRIDTITEQVGFARVQFTFDNTKVQLTDEISVNPVFAQQISSPTTMAEANSTGIVTVDYGIGTDNLSNPPSGDFSFISFPITKISTTDNDSVVFSVNLDQVQIVNLVSPLPDELPTQKTDLTIILNPAVASPTPTPTFTPTPTIALTPTPAPIGANLSLEGETTAYVGDNVIFDLVFSTDQLVSGVDADLVFDPNYFQVVSITPQNLLSTTSFSTFDNVLGRINFSQLEDPGTGYTGNGILAQIELEPVASVLQTDLAFDFTPGSTTDSNAVSFPGGEDILNQPLDFSVEILEHQTLTVNLNTPSADDSVDVRIYLLDDSWEYSFTTDSNGASTAFSLPDSWIGSTVDLYVKVDGYLVDKYSLDVVGGDATANYGNLRAGDLNNDGIVNTLDLTLMFDVWFDTSLPLADYNKDGEVNTFDYSILTNNFSATDAI